MTSAPPFKGRDLTCPHGRYWQSCPQCSQSDERYQRYRSITVFAEQMERELRVKRAKALNVE